MSAKATPTFIGSAPGVPSGWPVIDMMPRHALDHEVITRPLRVGSVLAEAGDRAIDQARIDGFQAVIVEAILLQPADLEVLDHDIGLARPGSRISFWPSALAMSMQTDHLPRLAERK